MRLNYPFLAFLVSTLFLSLSCQKQVSDTSVKKAFDTFTTALSENDFETVHSFLSDDALQLLGDTRAEQIQTLENTAPKGAKFVIKPKMELRRVEMADDGQSAVIYYDSIINGKKTVDANNMPGLPLVKVEGQWKVNYTLPSK